MEVLLPIVIIVAVVATAEVLRQHVRNHNREVKRRQQEMDEFDFPVTSRPTWVDQEMARRGPRKRKRGSENTE